jgi:hypothetical protein
MSRPCLYEDGPSAFPVHRGDLDNILYNTSPPNLKTVSYEVSSASSFFLFFISILSGSYAGLLLGLLVFFVGVGLTKRVSQTCTHMHRPERVCFAAARVWDPFLSGHKFKTDLPIICSTEKRDLSHMYILISGQDSIVEHGHRPLDGFVHSLLLPQNPHNYLLPQVPV